MILLDTTVLVYASGAEHAFRAPCRRLFQAHRDGIVQATTLGEVIQEFMHVHARRHPRPVTADMARSFLAVLPLITPTRGDVELGTEIYERCETVGAFDAVLAGVALGHNADALISADRAFGAISDLRWISPGTKEFDALLAGPD